jgi:hypothetical protein
VFPLFHVFDLFVNEFSGLRGWRFTLAFVLPGPFGYTFFRHFSPPGARLQFTNRF